MNKNEYSTTSLALAAALELISDGELLRIERVEDKRFAFVFKDVGDLHKIINLFWKRALHLDALSYFETLRYIKALLHEQEKGGNRSG